MTSRFLASRRQALQYLGVALGNAAVGSAAYLGALRSHGAADDELRAVADRMIAHRRSAGVIGTAYVAKFGAENSVELLAKAIRQEMAADGRPVDEQSLLAHIQSDFERCEVVMLQGWMLSRTEARLCALFAV